MTKIKWVQTDQNGWLDQCERYSHKTYQVGCGDQIVYTKATGVSDPIAMLVYPTPRGETLYFIPQGTKLDLTKIPDWIMKDVKEYWADNLREVPHGDPTVEQVFEAYCEWNGICRWASRLSSVLDALRGASR